MPDKINQLVLQYVENHRPAPAQDCEEFVFLTPQGRQIAHLAYDLKGLSKDFPTSLGVINVTSTQMLKLTSTYVAANGATDASIRTVATHMTHDPSTASPIQNILQELCKQLAKNLSRDHAKIFARFWILFLSGSVKMTFEDLVRS